MPFAQTLAALRRAQKLTQTQLALRSGVSQSAISAIEQGLRSPSESTIALLAKALGARPADMLSGEDDLPAGLSRPPVFRRVPLLGAIACGAPITAVENPEGYVSVAEDVSCDFALRCQGDSMSPRVQAGDLVYIRQQPDVEDGQIAAVLIGGEATLKHLYHIDGGIQLVPENLAYPPMVVTGEACGEVHVLGLAVAFQRLLA